MKPGSIPVRRKVVVFGWTMLLTLVLVRPVYLLGQIGTSGITGTVTDPSGGVVAGARVTVTNNLTSVESSTVTSGTGSYMVRNLTPGQYSVTVEAAGFEKSVTTQITTEVDKVTSVDVRLAVGATTQEVSVTATPAELLNTQSGVVGQLVTSKEITTLPLNGRSWISLNYLAPGAVNFHGTTAGESVMAAVTPTNVVLNGLRGGNNDYYIDGSSLQARETQVILEIPPLDALGEFRVQTADFSAEYIGGAGGVISAVTKSGTNEFHGDVWEYLRNGALDSRSFFDKSIPPFRRNQFGATLGGPIRKSRAFFFGGYEGFRQQQGQTLVGDYPTQAMRGGDLSSVNQTITNPLTGQPFPKNQVPVNPLSARWLNDWIPLPNTNVPVGQGNFRIAAPAPINYDSYIGRIDYTVGQKTNIFGRFLGSWENASTPWYIGGFLRPVENHGENYDFQLVHTFTPTTVAEFRFSYNRPFQNESTSNSKNTNMLNELGLVPGAYGFTTLASPALAPPALSVSGFTSFGNRLFGRPREFYGGDYHYDVLFFINRGSHNIKIGGNVWREFYNFPESILPTGSWSYNGFFTGYGFADFLLGYPRSVSALANVFHQDLWRWQNGVWVQDDWKVTQKLTVNLGLRWDEDARWISSSGTVANFDLSAPPTVREVFSKPNAQGCPTGGCSPVTPAGWNQSLVDSPEYLWSPRVGMAYHIGNNTVVRGGIGMYWQPLTTDPFVNESLNYPFVLNVGATYDFTNLATFDRTNPLLNSSAAGIGATATAHHIKDGYVSEWNLTLERTIGNNLISIGYVGNKGTDLYTAASPNLAPAGPGPINPRRPFTTVLAIGTTQTATGIGYQEGASDSNYQALQLRFDRRVGHGLTFTTSYAYGKCLSNSDGSYIESESATFQQPNNLSAERSFCEFDVRNALTFSYIYELPIGHGKAFAGGATGVANKLISGWQVQGLTSLFNGSHQAYVTNSYDNLNNGGTGYPDRVCNPNYGSGRSDAQKVAQFFNTACFVPAGGGKIGVPDYHFGNSTRHPLDSPGEMEWDFALQKETFATEKLDVRFSAEFFNIINRPNFSPPNTSFGAPQFGTLTAAGPGREIQFGLKLLF